jgi:hypothetical protein
MRAVPKGVGTEFAFGFVHPANVIIIIGVINKYILVIDHWIDLEIINRIKIIKWELVGSEVFYLA